MIMKSIIKDTKARVLPYTVAFLLVFAGLTGYFLVQPPQDIVIEAGAATVDQFSYYKSITLESDQVEGSSDLINFPILINLSGDADLKNRVQNSDGWDIAFFADDQSTQLNHEIELFDDSTGQLVAWVNITTLDYDEDTTIYMYYGDADISATSENIADTWNSDYEGVWHMHDYTTSQIHDSTIHAKHGTKNASNHPIQVSTNIGYGQDFDGIGDFINVTDTLQSYTFHNDHLFTAEIYLKYEYGGSTKRIMGTSGASAEQGWSAMYSVAANKEGCPFLFGITEDNSAGGDPEYAVYNYLCNITASEWNGYNYFGWYGVVNGGSNCYAILNGVPRTTCGSAGDCTSPHAGSDTFDADDNEYTFKIGSTGSKTDSLFNGTIDEIRLSTISRSNDWLITTYNTINNATNGSVNCFFTLGVQQEGAGAQASSFTISGYNETSFITWSGDAGTTVWNNATADQTLELNYNVNGTTNLTDIHLNMDPDDMDSGFFDQNLSVYVSFTNSSSEFALLNDDTGNGQGLFTDGYNLTINASTWPDSGAGGDPDFPVDPAAGNWENDTIYVRFKLAIPSGMSAGTYSSANTDWSVDFKYTTE